MNVLASGGRAAYEQDPWHDLAIAVVGAAAALIGLLFVAVSINLKEILKGATLPRLAAETLCIMVGLLFVSIFVLVPGQSRQATGSELAVVGAAFVVPIVLRLRVKRAPGEPLIWAVYPALLMLLVNVPLIVGGFSLIAGAGGGLYWFIGSLVFGLIATVVDSWVLLVEILR